MKPHNAIKKNLETAYIRVLKITKKVKVQRNKIKKKEPKNTKEKS